MMTVYGYQFEVPKPVEQPRTNPLVWVALAVAGWWWWRNRNRQGGLT